MKEEVVYIYIRIKNLVLHRVVSLRLFEVVLLLQHKIQIGIIS